MDYAIRKVDTGDAKVAETIAKLHRLTLGAGCPFPYLSGHWWLVFSKDAPVGFAGMKETTHGGAGYLCRAGVLRAHRGHGLQRKLIRVRERQAVANGWTQCCSDTSDNPISANNLIACGYRIFNPAKPWGFRHTIYWRRTLTK